jgi:hypothetical protein
MKAFDVLRIGFAAALLAAPGSIGYADGARHSADSEPTDTQN